MARKAFNLDVSTASEKKIPGIVTVAKGDDDGDVTVTYAPASGPPIEIGMLALDVSEYPEGNSFMLFTKSSEVPNGVNDVLEDVTNFSTGMKISELLLAISQRLQKVLASRTQADPFNVDDGSDVEMVDGGGEESEGEYEEDDEEEEEDEPFGYDDDDDGFGTFGPSDGKRLSTSSTYRISPEAAASINRRIRTDLRAAKFAGFKLGILSGMKAESHTSLLSISIQASKLGLSDEALQAWDLEPQQYIVLLVRYSAGYKPYESVISEPAKALDISFRIGVSNKYKPTLVEALAAFTEMTKNGSHSHDDQNNGPNQEGKSDAGFSSLFISSSLNEFFNEQYVSLLKIRSSVHVGWDGAKLFFNEQQGKINIENAQLKEEYFKETPPANSLPELMTADHLTDTNSGTTSFPLITAQFAMRYLLRCTEFCLVCHDRISDGFEALKPYVCDKPLCLYQYMSLGFGPSVEHEILTQPFVVDLLVSFCYSAALCQRIREYPTGMSLSVPPVASTVTQLMGSAHQHHQQQGESHTDAGQDISDKLVAVKYDLNRQEVIFEDGKSCPVRNGDWIVITPAGQHSVHHRVTDISLYPTVELSKIGVTQSSNLTATEGNQFSTNLVNPSKTPFTPATTPPPPSLIPAQMTVYDQNFDDMTEKWKAETIVVLLETLPSVKDLRTYLVQQGRFSEPNLRGWKERISPAALGLLRWIIASNRSCIVQVDKCPGQEGMDMASKIRLDQKCSNVSDNWVQFRFAQGAPDKEQRFLTALKTEQASLDARFPTLFAFHGSPLQNWHSIIRHGLDFKETMHGRAYGHGVYHAMDQNTSVGYMGSHTRIWPGSDLKIGSAMSLNEIVNCPSRFVSSHPFLVVQHVDWIQCRYLLVQINQTSGQPYSSGTEVASTAPTPSSGEVEQDPKYTARTTLNKPIGVPRCAISISRAFRANNAAAENATPTSKRRKHTSSNDKLTLAQTAISDDEEAADITFLFSDDDTKGEDLVILKSINGSTKPLTDFVPGSLDQSKLPMLEPPSYATPSATLRLNNELRTILKVQAATPLHELGWYIEPDLVSNVYQWIVELHSFEDSLPLAKDMKAAGITSIVLEIRFGKDYPHSPPFVRVIRPRFLPFTSGGGGHVTGGGAMCMELLTNSGWSAVSSIESVLLQVRMAIMNLEPRPARLESVSRAHQHDYGITEAMQAYIRACQAHGWQVPKDFQDFAAGVGPSGY